MEISDFVIHRILKEGNETGEVKLAAASAQIDDGVRKFTTKAVEAFVAKPTSIFAPFHANIEEYPFSERCRKYFTGELSFYDLSVAATNRLAARMEPKPTSTGGYVIFAAYRIDQVRHLLVLMLHKEAGFSVDDDTLALKDVTHLDLAQIDKAATVNGGVEGDAMPDKPLTYAGFRKTLSHYFQEFLGPDRIRNPKRESKELIRALDQYFDRQNMDSAGRHEIRAWVQCHVNEQAAANNDIELRTISARVNPQDPEDFATFANRELKISAVFRADPETFERWGLIRHKGEDGVVIQIPEEVLLNEEKVQFNAEENSLTFYDLPDDLNEKLRDALQEND